MSVETQFDSHVSIILVRKYIEIAFTHISIGQNLLGYNKK